MTGGQCEKSNMNKKGTEWKYRMENTIYEDKTETDVPKRRESVLCGVLRGMLLLHQILTHAHEYSVGGGRGTMFSSGERRRRHEDPSISL
jgi:hypothetical protein